MMTGNLRHLFSGLIFLLLLVSCVEDLDFGQEDNLEITPTYESSLLYIEVPERIINLSSGINFVSQNFNFDAFAEDLFSERAIDGVIVYEIENTTSKQLEIQVEFLDEAGNVLDTEQFTVQPHPTERLRVEIAYGDAGRSMDIIRSTSSIRVNATNLGDSSSTSEVPNSLVTFKSSAKFRLRIK